jgi:hypothetical protein
MTHSSQYLVRPWRWDTLGALSPGPPRPMVKIAMGHWRDHTPGQGGCTGTL